MDVLLVSLGSTAGLRRADDALAGALERAGASVAVARADPPREVRTLMATDLGWARAARRAAQRGLAEAQPRAVIYGTTTAALLWPRPGAIRFDALAADNRRGRHGLWQRPLERRRLREAPLLIPQTADVRFPTAVPVPIPVDPSGPPAPRRDIAAITYAANPEKKGLDRVLAAWAKARRPGEELVVAGLGGTPAGADEIVVGLPARRDRPMDGVRLVGALPPDEYRALVRRARVFVAASRYDEYGLAPLEALADGCALVTWTTPGPYVALPLARALDARLVARDVDGLARAVRTALDDPAPDYPRRAVPLLAPYSGAAVDALVADRLLPALLA